VEAQYKTANGRIVFKIEGGNQKAIFEGIANLQEVFESEDKCGLCGYTAIRFRVREVTKGSKTYKYFELTCPSCYGRFDFGQAQVGETLFPKRKDENGNWLPSRGWYKYQAKTEDQA
jgi:hypothetical protein